jgi:hypothetical protein
MRPPLWSYGQSSWLQIQRSGFDSRRYQIFWEVLGLEKLALTLWTCGVHFVGIVIVRYSLLTDSGHGVCLFAVISELYSLLLNIVDHKACWFIGRICMRLTTSCCELQSCCTGQQSKNSPCYMIISRKIYVSKKLVGIILWNLIHMKFIYKAVKFVLSTLFQMQKIIFVSLL